MAGDGCFDSAQYRIRYLLPLYNYHYRWSQLQPDDYTRAREGYDLDPLAGYTYLPRTTPFPEMEPKGETYTAAEYEKNEAYLLKTGTSAQKRDPLGTLPLAPVQHPLPGEPRTAWRRRWKRHRYHLWILTRKRLPSGWTR